MPTSSNLTPHRSNNNSTMADKAKQVEFSPTIPIPRVFDVQARIKALQGYLDPSNPNYEPEWQHGNIRAVIKLYEDTRREKPTVSNALLILMAILHASKMHSSRRLEVGSRGHFINGLRGGDGTAWGVSVLNDTGSTITSIFDIDLLHLGGLQAYSGWVGNIEIGTANGAVDICRSLLVEVQLVRDDLSPWTDWIEEHAIVRPVRPDVARLSGSGIRGALYFGTAPGNHTLAVSVTKGGLSALL
ncbi:hypothetical protein V491_00125 [Pseudogymnoascus sp. VKM F-3775]|nr:hypothetical protein V491_00125 [Pseudogymnoascus sp. VKM F-3775]